MMENNKDEILIPDYAVGAHPGIDLFTLRLAEPGGTRSLTIKIDETIALLFGMELPDQPPLTLTFYHIISALLEAQGATVKKVVVHDRQDGRFCSQLFIVDAFEKIHVVESVATHGAAIAFLLQVPVYVKNRVFDLACEDIDENRTINWYDLDTGYTVKVLSNLSSEEMAVASLDELERCLNVVLQEENYELAEKIRRVIQQKNQSTTI
jgi:bifunctional DNase/RNase